MILRFKTKRNTYGNRSYLAFDTEKKVYCVTSPRMVPDGEEITKKAMNNIHRTLANSGYVLSNSF